MLLKNLRVKSYSLILYANVFNTKHLDLNTWQRNNDLFKLLTSICPTHLYLRTKGTRIKRFILVKNEKIKRFRKHFFYRFHMPDLVPKQSKAPICMFLVCQRIWPSKIWKLYLALTDVSSHPAFFATTSLVSRYTLF